MAKVIGKRITAKMEGPFVVFLIGMRINKFWKFGKWWPVAMAMPKMLKELAADKNSGFLGGHSWFGRTTIMVQYWASFEQLEQYARNPDKQHYPAWVAFNKKIKSNGDVGIWHETYLVQPGQYENIYNNMPSFGLGKAAQVADVQAGTESARERVKNGYSNYPL